MEIWFCINHGRSAWPPFCLPLLSFSPFPFIGSARVSLLVPSSSFLVFSSLRIDPRFSARSLLVPCSSLLLREARDRHLHRWQGDSFVLSRRFQLIFIVYLPDRRYREDNGPPLYIRCSGKPYHQGLFIIFLCFSPVRLALLIGICVWFVGDGLRESTLLNAADWYLLEATRLYIHLDKTGERYCLIELVMAARYHAQRIVLGSTKKVENKPTILILIYRACFRKRSRFGVTFSHFVRVHNVWPRSDIA